MSRYVVSTGRKGAKIEEREWEIISLVYFSGRKKNKGKERSNLELLFPTFSSFQKWVSGEEKNKKCWKGCYKNWMGN